MKIAILTSGILPVPAVLGGAVENLIDFYLDYNENHDQHKITVYSVFNNESLKVSKKFKFVDFQYINNGSSFIVRIRRFFFRYLHKHLYYDPHIEYFLSKAMKRMGKDGFDIILLENRPGYALAVSEFTKAKLVIHLHNDLLNLDTAFGREILEKSSLVMAVSNFIKRRVDTISFSPKTVVVPNGIDLNSFWNMSNKLLKKTEFGFLESDFIVAYSGRIIPEKGVKELLQAFAMIPESFPIKLLIIGGNFYGNDSSDTEYMKELRLISASFKDRVSFTGFKPYAEISQFLSVADIAVIPSLWEEPFALTCVEAMAMGLPLVVTQSGGIPEVVDSDCAIIIEKNENISVDIMEGILFLYENKETRNRMGQHARTRSTLFSKESYAKLFFEKIKELF